MEPPRGTELHLKHPSLQLRLCNPQCRQDPGELTASREHDHQQGTQKLFSNQRSQRQAVSTSKHGSVRARGCCHCLSAQRGTLEQGVREEPLGKQELFWTAMGHQGLGAWGCLPPGVSSHPSNRSMAKVVQDKCHGQCVGYQRDPYRNSSKFQTGLKAKGNTKGKHNGQGRAGALSTQTAGSSERIKVMLVLPQQHLQLHTHTALGRPSHALETCL